jgi:hypothetical protein
MAADPIATRDWNPLRPDDSADAEVMLALLVFRWHWNCTEFFKFLLYVTLELQSILYIPQIPKRLCFRKIYLIYFPGTEKVVQPRHMVYINGNIRISRAHMEVFHLAEKHYTY